MGLHLLFRSQYLEFCSECFHIESSHLPFDAHKKQAGFVIAMLIGMRNVGAVSIKKVGNACHHAFTVWTVDEENSRISQDQKSA